MLRVVDLTVEVGHRLLVAEASFTVAPGDVVGLVGPNGAGKTSLLRTVSEKAASRRDPAVTLVGELAWLPQESPPTTASTGLARLLSARGLDQARQELEEARRKIDQSADELARVLLSQATTLLLDEPTNHLDADAKRWLAGFLADFSGGILLVSHDLPLLDNDVTGVLVLDPLTAGIETYKGTWTQYLAASEVRARSEAKQRKVLERDIKRLSTFVEKYRHSNETMARRAMVTERRVEKMKANLTPERRSGRKVAVRFPDPPPSGRFPLDAVDLSRSYGGPPVFKHVSFDLQRGERLLVLGLNGAGKTSLLRILAGIDQPDEGEVRLGHGAELGYYAQEHEGLDPEVTAMESLREVAKAPDDVLRGVLGHFLLGGDQAHQPARTLSGGEKTKLALARLVLGRHNVLLLDEPTNNLDVQAVEAVRSALETYKGSVVLVSHDTPFVQSFEPDRVLLMPDGALDVWSEDYLDLVALD